MLRSFFRLWNTLSDNKLTSGLPMIMPTAIILRIWPASARVIPYTCMRYGPAHRPPKLKKIPQMKK